MAESNLLNYIHEAERVVLLILRHISVRTGKPRPPLNVRNLEN